jgi:sulfur dioxygenase
MIVKQLFAAQSSTYTYILFDETSKKAVIIDPVDVDMEKYVNELKDYTLVLILDTHVHADHITGASLLKDETGAKYGVLAGFKGVDVTLQDNQILQVGDMQIKVITTPGHTSDSVCFLSGENLFTGDTLLIGKCGRTDFQKGSSSELYDSVTQKLFTLPNETIVYPGHDYAGNTKSSIGQEKELNLRLANKTREEFVDIMDNLNLSYPKMMNLAVPANKRCGRKD